MDIKTMIASIIQEKLDESKELSEKATSKVQQMAAGVALAAKRGEIKVSELEGASKEMYDGMSEKELEDFASTKHKGLPQKVAESYELNEDVHNDLNDMIIDFQRKLMRINKSKLDPKIAKDVEKIDSDLDNLRTGPLFKIRPGR